MVNEPTRIESGNILDLVLTSNPSIITNGQTTCECGDEQTMKHLLVCPVRAPSCHNPRPTHEDLEYRAAGIVQPPSYIMLPALGGSRVVIRKEELLTSHWPIIIIMCL